MSISRLVFYVYDSFNRFVLWSRFPLVFSWGFLCLLYFWVLGQVSIGLLNI